MKNNLYSKIYLWLFIGLIVTYITGLYTSNNEAALNVLFGKGMYWILIIIELGLAIFLSVRIRKMKPTTAKVCYLLYSFFTGLSFASLFIVYKLTSIIMIFGITAILFLIFAAIGKYSKIDLSKLGVYLVMILFGVIICSIVNFFIGSSSFDFGISIFSIIVFLGFIAYDVQKIERLEGFVEDENLAILGAFELYLDFINVFIDLIRIFGESKD